MSKFTERRNENKKNEARAAFSTYVQSVAFHMSLSRAMIEALWAVREWGSAGLISREHVSQYVCSHNVPLMNQLMRRGLVWHDYIVPLRAPKDHRYFKLTRAGELMCELLAEAHLIPSSESKGQRRASR